MASEKLLTGARGAAGGVIGALHDSGRLTRRTFAMCLTAEGGACCGGRRDAYPYGRGGGGGITCARAA